MREIVEGVKSFLVGAAFIGVIAALVLGYKWLETWTPPEWVSYVTAGFLVVTFTTALGHVIRGRRVNLSEGKTYE